MTADITPENVARMLEGVTKLIDALEWMHRHWMQSIRTADFHDATCKCYRCAEDAVFEAFTLAREAVPAFAARLAEVEAERDFQKKCRLEEKAKISRQAKALTDLKAHCKRVEGERDGLARKVAEVQRSGDDLAHSELADLQARVHNQRQEIAQLRTQESRAVLVAREAKLREALVFLKANYDCADVVDAALQEKPHE